VEEESENSGPSTTAMASRSLRKTKASFGMQDS
jgi:hypothetical protein